MTEGAKNIITKLKASLQTEGQLACLRAQLVGILPPGRTATTKTWKDGFIKIQIDLPSTLAIILLHASKHLLVWGCLLRLFAECLPYSCPRLDAACTASFRPDFAKNLLS